MPVKPGLEVLLEDQLDLIQDQRVGIVVHPASVNARLEPTGDLLFNHPGVNLTTILGPQHGIQGETQDNMIEWEGFRDPATELPVYSLYGKTRSPTREMLKNVDVVVFDLQDVGARYYTYIHTLALVMRACREHGKSLVVLDRPNPINGVDTEGTVLDPEFSSFVGLYPLAMRHGMTVGELALYFNREFQIDCRLEIVKMQGWTRDMFFSDTRLPWVLPSPNMPTLETALVYPGLCLLEGTNVSEGRGTTRPFELSGAPWITPARMVEQLDRLDQPGVVFRPVHFTPTFHKWAGESIGGVQIHVSDRAAFRPVLTGLALLTLYRKAGEGRFAWKSPPYEYEEEKPPIDILCGTDRIRQLIEAEAGLDELQDSWRTGLEEFLEIRRGYLLY
ncbi:MAG: DUF1343 domain-containing protein [Acidobacteriota bacterium]|nr:DUF1343 domain-containing protein [Acidobacteriota bacterium]